MSEAAARGRNGSAAMQRRVHDVTACIPTSGRLPDLVRTVETLLSGEVVPETTLVSHCDSDPAARSSVAAELAELERRTRARIVLLGPPPCGNRSGNRNWLSAHVDTPYLLFADDDVDVDAFFLAHAVGLLRSDAAGIVVAATRKDGSGWLTPRGHFRARHEGEPIAVGFACVLMRTRLFREFQLDEAIRYAYEDADFSLRLHASRLVSVVQSPYPFVDRGQGRTVGLTVPEVDAEMERARLYVGVKRYAASRSRLAVFLAREVAASLVRRRGFPPAEMRPRQWADVTRYLLGGKRPAWAGRRGIAANGTSSPARVG